METTANCNNLICLLFWEELQAVFSPPRWLTSFPFLSFSPLFYDSFLSENSDVLNLYSRAPLALMVIMMIIINNLQSGVAAEGPDSLTFHFSLMCFYLKYYNHDNIIAFPSDVISLQLYLPSPGNTSAPVALNIHIHIHIHTRVLSPKPRQERKEKLCDLQIHVLSIKTQSLWAFRQVETLEGMLWSSRVKLGRSLRPNIDTLIHTWPYHT